MPAKIARLATRPPFWIPEVSVAVRSSRPSCSKVEKREYSWQIGSHPGNPGFRPQGHQANTVRYTELSPTRFKRFFPRLTTVVVALTPITIAANRGPRGSTSQGRGCPCPARLRRVNREAAAVASTLGQ